MDALKIYTCATISLRQSFFLKTPSKQKKPKTEKGEKVGGGGKRQNREVPTLLYPSESVSK
jgi:hypothetical protein